MDFEWVAIAVGDVVWISVAFALGFLSKGIRLPPLVGFLAAGFILSAMGFASGAVLEKVSDLGITLLLFTVGLKLNPRTLMRPQVWAVAGVHTSVVVLLFASGIYGLVLIGAPFFSDLDIKSTFLLAFALSFSSTVFAVKALDDKGEVGSLHGRIAIGILIMQDLAAVLFLAASVGAWPSWLALLLLLLIPLRPVLLLVLKRTGHGELLVLYGFLLALGGAELFELVGMKGDLGALALGVLIANHPKSREMSKVMLGFKDLFLLGFFLSIGSSGQLTWPIVLVAAVLLPLVLVKAALFFTMFTAFKLRARTALFSTFNLTNYSEFGLIVAAVGAANGWIDSTWLIVISVSLSLSFALSASLTSRGQWIYSQHRAWWRRFQRKDRLADDRPLDVAGAAVVVFGIGRVGVGAYDRMRELYGDQVVGVDVDPAKVSNLCETGRNVLLGDPSDADFWDRVRQTHSLEIVMLALPKINTSLAVLHQLRESGFAGQVAAVARYPDEIKALQRAGAQTVFNIYTEAGAGFAAHVAAETPGTR